MKSIKPITTVAFLVMIGIHHDSEDERNCNSDYYSH